MDKIMDLANKHGILVVEDAAHAVDSFYTGADGIKKALGSIGHFATFSFHETKNITCGEGGMLVVNDNRFWSRAEIIWEKGTNRSAFFRGEVDKYSWVDLGSSFLLSEINASYLWAQIENLDLIQQQRISHWQIYMDALGDWAADQGLEIPMIPDYATNNAHMFYLVCKDVQDRTELMKKLHRRNIEAVFHYQSLHKSPFYRKTEISYLLPQADRYSDCLLRLPMYFELAPHRVIEELLEQRVESGTI
jgi:dTDP-4-amino-4,6-dideoxygalactose transaminase